MRGTGFILMIILAVTALSGCASQSENIEQMDVAVKPTPTPVLSPEERTAALEEQPEVIEAITVGESQVALRQNEQEHKAYIQALKENDYDKTPELCMADPSCYAFYDIDGNGVDELIVCDGYFAICLFTYQDEKVLSSPVVYLSHEKYGGRFRLYPEKKMIELPDGGHMDHYYGRFIRVNGTKVKCVAEKDWTVHYLSDTETKTTYKYKISGKRVTKEKYQKYVREIKATKMVKRKELKWSEVSALRKE